MSMYPIEVIKLILRLVAGKHHANPDVEDSIETLTKMIAYLKGDTVG